MEPRGPEQSGSPRDLERARQNAIGQLLTRGIEVSDTAGADALVDLLEAVELFEATIAARGGDSFTNTIDSSSPDQPDLTLPRPRADESIQEYTGRVRARLEHLRPNG